MGRTSDIAFFACPICGKKPYVNLYGINVGTAYCKGYGFHRHKKVSAFIRYAQPSKLLEKLAISWNSMRFEEARYLFDMNGNPFRNEKNL